MQCACAVLSSVACPVLQYFSALSFKRYDFRGGKKVTVNEKCFDLFYKVRPKHFSF